MLYVGGSVADLEARTKSLAGAREDGLIAGARPQPGAAQRSPSVVSAYWTHDPLVRLDHAVRQQHPRPTRVAAPSGQASTPSVRARRRIAGTIDPSGTATAAPTRLARSSMGRARAGLLDREQCVAQRPVERLLVGALPTSRGIEMCGWYTAQQVTTQ